MGEAAGAASFPLPSAAVAAVDAGRPVYFRHARTGKVYRLITESTDADAKGDAAAWSPENVAADGGERLTELEALRRAVTEADAELAAGLEPLTLESFWAGVGADFPELRRQAD